jgi:hypothetical protein
MTDQLELNDKLDSLKRLTQGFRADLEGSNTRLEEIKACLSEMADILELLSKTLVISDQIDLSYRHRVMRELEGFKKTQENLEKLSDLFIADGPAMQQKMLELVNDQEKAVLAIENALKDLAASSLESLKYLRKLSCEDPGGRPLTGWAWTGYHFSKGAQTAIAGIVVAFIYYLLRFGLPKILGWH